MCSKPWPVDSLVQISSSEGTNFRADTPSVLWNSPHWCPDPFYLGDSQYLIMWYFFPSQIICWLSYFLLSYVLFIWMSTWLWLGSRKTSSFLAQILKTFRSASSAVWFVSRSCWEFREILWETVYTALRKERQSINIYVSSTTVRSFMQD
jgi:hypothetical protein